MSVRDLGKRFGTLAALDGLTLEIATGELFGFIGPDGAGKTTLLRVLTTLLVPDAGEARVLGLDVVRDVWSIRAAVGYMPGRFSLYPDLSVEENLRFFASVFGTRVEAHYDLIAPIYSQIERFRGRRAGALSGGMKQKLALCCALVHRPRILFLDEPTTGVDAVSRRELWEVLAGLRAGGLTIAVSTPYMDEAERCDRVALIQGGRLLQIASPGTVGAEYPLPLLGVSGRDRYRLLGVLREHPHAASVYPFGQQLHYTDRRAGADREALAAEIQAYLAERGYHDSRVVPTVAGIEDSFLARMAPPIGGSA